MRERVCIDDGTCWAADDPTLALRLPERHRLVRLGVLRPATQLAPPSREPTHHTTPT